MEIIFGPEEAHRVPELGQKSLEATMRVGVCPTPWALPLPHGPLVAPLADFFRLYISIYPKTIGEQNRSGVSPPQASVATKNQGTPR